MLQKENNEELEQIKLLDLNLNPWKIKEELLNENIIHTLNRDSNKIRLLTEVLNEDEKHDKKKKIKNYQSFDGNRKRRKRKISSSLRLFRT